MENTPDYLKDSPFVQAPQELSRHKAEYFLQQAFGPVIGVKRMSDEEIRRRLPPQFKLVP